MRRLISKFLRPSTFLFSEFIVIVLGVLAALAVDEWREARDQSEVRSFLIESFLEDLRDDISDYQGFMQDQALRQSAAKLLIEAANNSEASASVQETLLGEALYKIGRSSLLETAEGTYQEMTMHGTGSSITDIALRLEIERYYALAHDRSDVNAMVYSPLERYRDALNEVGLSYTDRGNMDVRRALSSRRVIALIREIEVTAEKAQRYEDLIAVNQDLISKLEQAKAID